METLTLTINGLFSDPNNWSETPPGALEVADDIVIDKPSIAECRRGQARYGLLDGMPDKFYSYQGSLLAHYENMLAYDENNTGIFIPYTGVFASPDEMIKPRHLEANENFYLTSSDGVKKLDQLTSQFTESGAPPGLGGTYTLTNSGSGFMSNDKQIAYRIVWGYVDANDNENVGAPSQRLVVINTTGETADVILTWDIPDDITTDWFYRVFRSGFSAGASFPPDDELGQIKEGSVSSAEITAGQFTFTDIVPDSLRGAKLYTSPSQEGILQSNEQPPWCIDMCSFRNLAWYFNTKLKNRFFGTLVSVGDNTLGGTFGYQTNNGDTHTNTTIDGLTNAASVIIQDLTYTADDTGVGGNDISITYIDGATAGNEIVSVDDNAITVQIETGVSTATQIKAAIDNSPDNASLIVQDLTYTADLEGVSGNLISITYNAGGTAGSEVVTVLDNAIAVLIEDGVSTASQINLAILGSTPATDLIDVVVSGTGSNPQNIISETFLTGGNDDASDLVDVTISGTGATAQVLVAQTFLEDGFDTTYLNIGMRVVGSGVVAGTLIASIDSISAITVDTATTATATVALEFQDRFSISDMDYWAASTADYPNRQFVALLSGTPGENIEQTTLNLIQAINKDPNNNRVYAFYTTNSGELPGSFLIQERNVGGPSFYVTSTNGASFSPVLPFQDATQISDNDARQNRVYFSKVQQPEAVPLVNFLDIGSENFPIVRALANRDSIFVLKDGEGVYRISGTDSSTFTASIFNSSINIKAPESAVLINNQICTFSDQNVVVIDESGVAFVSDPQIQSIFNQLSSDNYPQFDQTTFGVSYETDRSYLIFTVTNFEDEYATQGFRYNFITNSWTRWEMPRSCGLVLKSDGKLYMGNPVNNYVYQERKNFDRTDYADEEFEITITAVDGLTLSVTDSSEVGEGDLIKQDDLEAIVTEVVDDTTILVSLEQNWQIDTAQVFQKIPGRVKWIPNAADNPGILKHFTEATFLFKNAPFYTANAGFGSDLNDSTDIVPLSAASGQGWGQFPWGERPWAVPGGRSLTIRTYVPLESQRASWLNVEVENLEAYSNFSLSGVTVQFEPMSSRQR